MPASREKKKSRKKKRFWKWLLILAAVLCLVAAGLWYYVVGQLYGKIQYEEIEGVAEQPMKEEDVINILLIGNDSRKNGSDGRSDAMILLSVSNETKTIHLTSLLRDMYVEIPGHGSNRLNAAYAYGGPKLLMETLETNFDIHVNRYASVNFRAFANLVDAVGGVDLELTNEEVKYINGYLVEYNMLEGKPEGTDYLDPAGLIDGILPNLTTNLTEAECRSLSLQAAKLLSYDVVQESIPIKGSYSNATIDGMSVLKVDFETNKEYIRTAIYGD